MQYFFIVIQYLKDYPTGHERENIEGVSIPALPSPRQDTNQRDGVEGRPE